MATAEGNSVAAADDPLIDGLLQGSQWGFGAGPHVLTYSFNISGVPGAGNWTAAQEAGVRAAFAAWSAVANIQFKEVKSGTYFYQSTADIALSLTGNLQQQSNYVGEAEFPDAVGAANDAQYFLDTYAPNATSATYANPQGDIFLDNQALPGYLNPFGYFSPGGESLATVLHEIGHVLGLKHPFDDGGNNKPTFAQLGIGDLDTNYNTVMSYTKDSQPPDYIDGGQYYWIDWGNPSTPMPLDILAIQYLYGVNRTTNTGNNTYYFRDNGTVQTIWDAGGYDTIDASGLPSQSLIGYNTIDLRPGQISRYVESWLGPKGQESVSAIAMSYTPTETQDGPVAPIDNLIERAIGSAGNDHIYGNSADNTLLGGGGSDQLIDTAGNDYLDGGTGADQMSGGIGDDTYVIDNLADWVQENANEGTDSVKTSVAINSAIANVENYTYTGSANWSFTGNDLDNALTGSIGMDTLSGGLGKDVLNGGSNADRLIGGQGDDTYVIDNIGDTVVEAAGEGTDLIKSSISLNLAAGAFIGQEIEHVTLTGTAALNVTGNSLDNTLTGNAAANIIDGGIGADAMAGGLGNDTYVIDNAKDTVIEAANAGSDTVKTSVAITTAMDNVENYIFTGTGNWQFTGNELNNAITGGAGNDTLDGGTGADTLAGGLGNDTYVIDNIGDKVTELAGQGTDTLKASVSINLSAGSFAMQAIENVTLEGSAALNATGNTLVNVLTGNDGNNILDGGAGADTLSGGQGDDTYVIDNAGDQVIEADGEGIDTVRSSILPASLINNVENYTYTGALAWSFTGNDLDNALTGGAGMDTLSGGLGNDVLNGGSNADKLIGGQGDDTYVIDNIGDTVVEAAGEGTDLIKSSVSLNLAAGTFIGQEIEHVTLTGTAALNVTGNGLDNILLGNDGANVLDGGAGADAMAGGLGNDTYVIDNAKDTVIEAANAGSDTVKTSVAITTAMDNVENYIFTGTGNWQFTGNELNNAITGGAGNDTLDGGTGADTLAGGLGNDTYVIDNIGDKVTELAGQGTDTVILASSYSGKAFSYGLGANLEDLNASQMAVAVTATGNAANNVITTGSGNDILDGGAGADTLSGGQGDDTYIIDNAGDQVIEADGAGIDTVRSSILLASVINNVENYTYTGALAWSFTGDDQDNALTGGAGMDTLSGGLGNDVLDGGSNADRLIGGQGDDTYVIDNIGDTVVEAAGEGTDLIKSSVSLNLAAGAFIGQEIEHVTLTGTAAINVTGNGLDNILTGNAAANILTGGAGNDTLDGGIGADTLIGGQGDDTYVIDNAGDKITELAGQGTDTIIASIGINLSAGSFIGQEVENVTLTGNAAINATGNALSNTLIGNDGSNLLDGGGGADVMIGGLGDDTYIVDNVGDVVTESTNGGNDTVRTLVAIGTAIANVENYIFIGAGDWSFTGDDAANKITGSTGNDTLDGGAGADTLTGGAGNDTYYLDNAGDRVIEAAGGGNDTIIASVTADLSSVQFAGQEIENVKLTGSSALNATGNALNNTLTGNSGDNILDGGAGADTMIGGAGDDTYIIDNALDNVFEAAGGGTDLILASVSIILTGALDRLFYLQEIENVTLTGSANIGVTGNLLDNTLTGNVGDNWLDGNSGDDTMIGGAGNDTYTVDSVGDSVVETLAGSAGGTDLVLSYISYTLGANVENLTLHTNLGGTSADLNGTGNELDNIITGNDGNNILNGGAGADTLIGGKGNDTYIIDNKGDTITEAYGAGTDTAILAAAYSDSSLSYTLGNDVEKLDASQMTAGMTLTGNGLANTITGGSGDDVLNGGGALDTLIGGQGNDTYIMMGNADLVVEAGGGGVDLIEADFNISLISGSYAAQEIENVTLLGVAQLATGNGLNNVLTGNATNNVLDGGAGADTLIGGKGDDYYYIDDIGDTVVENANEGTDSIMSSVAISNAITNVENYSYSGAANWSFTANDLNNVITGGTGNDTLIGLGGNDTLSGGGGDNVMIGGSGDDTYLVYSLGDTVIENSGEGIDTVKTPLAINAIDNVENYIYAGVGNWVFTGNSLDNSITGGAGNDTLSGGDGNDTINGGAGVDTMSGGNGNDTYVVDNIGDTVIEAVGGGTDLIKSSISIDLTSAQFAGQEIENIALTGSYSTLTARGNALNNVITGSDIAVLYNTLDGGAGADTLIGGNAIQTTYVVDDPGDVVILSKSTNTNTSVINSSVSFSLANMTGGGTVILQLTGSANINGTGGAASDHIIGNVGNNVLSGGAGSDWLSGSDGDDVLIGGAGADVLDGGTGNDTVSYAGASAGVDANLAANAGSGIFSDAVGDTFVSIENLTGSSYDDMLTGNSGNNVLNGNGGNDILIGDGGYDTYKFDGTGRIGIQNIGERLGSPPSGELDFGSGITAQDLWFVRSNVSDLVIEVLGTNSQVMVNGWFGNIPSQQLSEIVLADGFKIDSSVSQVVTAMATYSANNPSFNPAASNTVMPQDQTLQNAITTAWHK